MVIDPDKIDSPISGTQIREAINGDFRSKLLGLSLSIENEEETKWPLIIGLSVGAVLLILVLVSVTM